VYDGVQEQTGASSYISNLVEAPERLICLPVHAEQCTDYVLQMLTEIKKRAPEKSIILGGHPIFAIDRNIFKIYPDSFDYLIRGEAEETIVELISSLDKGNPEIEKIPGLSFKRDGKFFRTPKRKRNLDYGNFALAARDVWENGKGRPTSNSALVSYSRGCNHHCSFCSVAPFYGKNERFWHPRPNDQFIEELSFLKGNYDIDDFTIIDPNLLGCGGEKDLFIRDFSSALKEANLNMKYEIATRVDALNPHRIEALYESGLRRIFLGLETGVDRLLHAWAKNLHPSLSIEILNKLVEAGIYVEIGFIMLHPTTTFQEIRENISYLKKLPYFHFYCLDRELWAFHQTSRTFNMDKSYLLPSGGRIYRTYQFRDPRIRLYQRMCSNLTQGLGGFFGHLRELMWNNIGKKKDILAAYINTNNALLKPYVETVELGIEKIERGGNVGEIDRFILEKISDYQDDFFEQTLDFSKKAELID